jgi:hypothetical protein
MSSILRVDLALLSPSSALGVGLSLCDVPTTSRLALPELLVDILVIIGDGLSLGVVSITRTASQQQTPGTSVQRQTRNLDPALHPFERAREYTRALNATKMDRMFAQPFLAQLGRGHVDGVYTMAKDPNSLERFTSGSGDGVVKVWGVC